MTRRPAPRTCRGWKRQAGWRPSVRVLTAGPLATRSAPCCRAAGTPNTPSRRQITRCLCRRACRWRRRRPCPKPFSPSGPTSSCAARSRRGSVSWCMADHRGSAPPRSSSRIISARGSSRRRARTRNAPPVNVWARSARSTIATQISSRFSRPRAGRISSSTWSAAITCRATSGRWPRTGALCRSPFCKDPRWNSTSRRSW